MLSPKIHHKVIQLTHVLNPVQLLEVHLLVENLPHQWDGIFHFLQRFLYKETAPEKLYQCVSVVGQPHALDHLVQ